MPISAEKQLERRRKILSATRDMINHVGYENLNVRELARHCGVSVPTLYNQFQRKDDLVYAAASEIYRLNLDKVASTCKDRGLDRLIYTLNWVDDMIKTNPKISSILVNVTPAKSESAAYGERLYTQPVVEMHEDGELVDWIDPVYIGQRIYARIRGALLEWSHAALTDAKLITVRHTDTYFMLLGISVGETKDRLEKLIRKKLKLR